MTDIQAALGLSQLKRLKNIVTERNRLFQEYRKRLAKLPLKLLEIPQDVKSSLHLAVIRLTGCTPENHRLIFEELRNAGIGVQLLHTGTSTTVLP